MTHLKTSKQFKELSEKELAEIDGGKGKSIFKKILDIIHKTDYKAR
ncbi:MULTISPECIES: bacteriocin class II family protein [Streptococcus]|nr:bacteriocin class II family protein [Streptococcus thoraltensis]MDY4760524.1 bacteriocin class II family protein [Streptococcus thoraltensis]